MKTIYNLYKSNIKTNFVIIIIIIIYNSLVVQHKLNDTSDEKQFEALRKGFYDVISKEISSILDEYDLKVRNK